MPQHLLFEGPELAGKSWLMSRVYDHLEPKYNRSRYILDGCHWFNADVGIFGTPAGQEVIGHYLGIFASLHDRNLMVEKFHVSDQVYNRLYRQQETDYGQEEARLLELGFKIVLITFPEDEAVVAGRLQDRLNLYPHYERILHGPEWYLKQQALYRERCARSRLPVLEVRTDSLPDERPVQDILKWIGEI